jgi:hypothetical protein
MVEMRRFGDFATFKYGKMPPKQRRRCSSAASAAEVIS